MLLQLAVHCAPAVESLPRLPLPLSRVLRPCPRTFTNNALSLTQVHSTEASTTQAHPLTPSLTPSLTLHAHSLTHTHSLTLLSHSLTHSHCSLTAHSLLTHTHSLSHCSLTHTAHSLLTHSLTHTALSLTAHSLTLSHCSLALDSHSTCGSSCRILRRVVQARCSADRVLPKGAKLSQQTARLSQQSVKLSQHREADNCLRLLRIWLLAWNRRAHQQASCWARGKFT